MMDLSKLKQEDKIKIAIDNYNMRYVPYTARYENRKFSIYRDNEVKHIIMEADFIDEHCYISAFIKKKYSAIIK
jgi:hypothetical protein